MKIKEIIALTLAGYKKSDIDELLKLELDEPKEEEKKEAETHKEEKKEEPDYKSMFETLQAETEQLKTALAEAQSAVTKQDVSKEQPKVDDLDTLRKIFS